MPSASHGARAVIVLPRCSIRGRPMGYFADIAGLRFDNNDIVLTQQTSHGKLASFLTKKDCHYV